MAAKTTRTPKAPLPDNALQPATRAAWRRWLLRHHTRDTGIWFVYFKKGSGRQRYTYEDIVEEALCFGWIDGLARALDDERAMLWLSPRKPRSVWSAPNKARVARVRAAGLMHPAGEAKVDAAIRTGAWNALDTVDRLEVPDDLARAFAQAPPARAHFDAFPASARKAMLEWVRQAKRAATRKERIERVARMAAANVRLSQAALNATAPDHTIPANAAPRAGTAGRRPASIRRPRS